jgi:hypothetical protein
VRVDGLGSSDADASGLEGAVAELIVPAGAGVRVRLGDGLQPNEPVTVSLPADARPDEAAVPVLLQVDDEGTATLLPASYDASTDSIVAKSDHLSGFWPQWFDVGGFFDGLGATLNRSFGLGADKPSCSGQSVSSLAAGELTLPAVYRGDGDGTVWPCLRVLTGSPERVELKLTSNTGLPYRVRATGDPDVASGGSLNPAKVAAAALYNTVLRSPRYAESLLIPTGTLTLTWPASSLPIDVALKVDAATHLAYIGASAVATIIGGFGGRVMESAEALSCLEAAVAAAVPSEDDRGPGALSAAAAGAILSATFDCATTVAGDSISRFGRVVLAALSAGVGAFVASVQGAWRSATGNEVVQFRIGQERIDARDVGMSRVSFDGGVCGVDGDIVLEDDLALAVPSTLATYDDGLIDVYGNSDDANYGDLTGDGIDEVVISVFCANHGSTAAGQLIAPAIVFDVSSSEPVDLAIAVAQHPTESHIAYFESFDVNEGTLVGHELWYRDEDGTCCPSGRATTRFSWDGQTLSPLETTTS